MKKVLKLLLVFVFFIGINDVFAASRNDKSTKTPIVIQGKTFYAGVEVDFNNHSRVGFIGDLDISYDASTNTITAKVKRSSINGIVEDSDKNVYFNIELNIDYHYESKDEYIMRSNEDGSIYWLDFHAKDVNESYIEFVSTAMEIYGGPSYTATLTGTYTLFKGDYFSSHDEVGDHNPSDFANQEKEVSLNNVKFVFSIDEDVKADMKNIETIDVGDGNEGSAVVEDILINNFYQIVDNNAKAVLSLSMYDEANNPIELNDNDIDVKVDESENMDTIKNFFEENTEDKIRVLTFNYAKEFKGKAKIKSYVKDKFKDNEKLRVYYYNQAKGNMDVVLDNVTMDGEGYISFDTTHFSEYVITSSENSLTNSAVTIGGIKLDSSNKYIYYGLLGLVVVIIVILVCLLSRKKKINNDVVETKVEKEKEIEEKEVEEQEQGIEEQEQEEKKDD